MFFFSHGQPVVPQVKLDVAANMNFGNRIFLVPVLLGIVITRFIRCNQGKSLLITLGEKMFHECPDIPNIYSTGYVDHVQQNIIKKL